MRSLSIAFCCVLSAAITGCAGGGSSALPSQGGGGGNSALTSQGGALIGSASSKRTANASIANPYTSLVLSDTPIAYYRLNDAASTMTDSGTNQLNGVYGANVQHGGAALTSAGDNSSIFPGSPVGSDIPSNTGTVAPNTLFTTASTGLTLEAWIKPADYNRTNNFVSIIAYGRGAIGNAWTLQVTPQSGLDIYMKVNGTPSSYELKPSGATLSPSQVYHVVATYDGSSVKLYLNGRLAQSVPASGSINYSGISPAYGLGVGGALGNTRPIFNGAINDAAVYATALSPAQVENHYIVGSIVQPLVETPTSSDAFVDSIGVVTHLRSSGTPYNTSWSTFETLLEASGIRHIGDALIATPAIYPQRINELANAGIHASLITGLTQTSQDIAAALPIFANSVEAVEGPNEPDLSGDPNWAQNTRNFQQMLWSTIKNNSATAQLTVVGPSTTSQNSDIALGDLSSYMDVGALHDYFSGYNPGTTGWGGLSQYGVYGSIAWNMSIAAIVSGTKPNMSTETGYSDSLTNSGGIDSRTLARYVPRIYLEHFLHGIRRTTLYQFYDDSGSGSFNNFGLVGVNNTPKTSYFALKSLIQTLSDPGGTFSTKPLSYRLTGNMNNVNHLLLQKRDGTYQLVLWVETASFDPNAKTDIAVPGQTLSLQLTNLPTSGTISTIGDAGTLTTSSLTFQAGVTALSIDDHVTVVSFK